MSKSIEKYDRIEPTVAVLMAWKDAGTHPQWHKQQQDALRKSMPLLGRALDRLVDNSRRA